MYAELILMYECHSYKSKKQQKNKSKTQYHLGFFTIFSVRV